MESRLDDTDEKKNILQTLPHETLLNIFEYNDIRDLTFLQLTSHFFNDLIKDDTYWSIRHKKYFLDTPFKGDNKNQYIAAEKHAAIFSAVGADQQQIAAIACQRFIKPQPLKWSNYHRGLLLFNGLGQRPDLQQGFQYFLDALDNYDYRAALKIVRIIIESLIVNPVLYKEFMLKFDPARQKLALTLLTNAHNTRILSINRLFGSMYTFGICTTKNIIKAEEYFLEAAKSQPTNSIMALTRSKYDSLPKILSAQQKAIEAIEYLKKFKPKLEKKYFKLVLNYWRGFLAYLQDDDVNARRFLMVATAIPKARLLLAEVFINSNLTELAIIHLSGIVYELPTEVIEALFRIKIRQSSLEETIQFVLDLTGCRKIDIAVHACAKLRSSHSIDVLAESAYYVWWLQLAAQAGCVKSLKKLESIDPNEVPYICLARAVISKFGIFGSGTFEAKPDQTEYFFSLVRDKEKIKDYIQTAIDHDFSPINSETLKLLESKINNTPRNRK